MNYPLRISYQLLNSREDILRDGMYVCMCVRMCVCVCIRMYVYVCFTFALGLYAYIYHCIPIPHSIFYYLLTPRKRAVLLCNM